MYISHIAAIHLFISSHDEIKDFCSIDKKTGRRYLRRVQFYTIYNHTKNKITDKKFFTPKYFTIKFVRKRDGSVMLHIKWTV